jgi:uncharacterized protein with PIN domain
MTTDRVTRTDRCPDCQQPYVDMLRGSSDTLRGARQRHRGPCSQCRECGEWGWWYGISHYMCERR